MKVNISPLPDQKRIFCNKCQVETNHLLKGEHVRRDYDEGGWIEILFRFWICAGCERATLEECYTGNRVRDKDGQQIYFSVYRPRRTKSDFTEKYFFKLPPILDKIYRETIRAFNEDLIVLCVTGLRALIDAVCKDKQISGYTLETRVDNLSNIVPQNMVKGLHSFEFLSSDPIHELRRPPSGNEIRSAIEVCEDLLNVLYELDYNATQNSRNQRRGILPK